MSKSKGALLATAACAVALLSHAILRRSFTAEKQSNRPRKLKHPTQPNRPGEAQTMLTTIRTAARRAARTTQQSRRAYAPSITYSGGQASEGQGGFYGSGGARVAKGPVSWDHKAVASSEAIRSLTGLMEEASKLEERIRSGDELDDAVIEAKGALKKLMTGDEVTELLEGLEMGGEPVWGLSTKERRLVREAKEKIHAV